MSRYAHHWLRYALVEVWPAVWKAWGQETPPGTWYVGYECSVCGEQGYGVPG